MHCRHCCVFGATEIAIATCLFLGGFRTVAYGAGLAVGVVSVVVSWRRFLDPRGDPANRLLIAGAPVPDLLIALFLLWHWDRGVVVT